MTAIREQVLAALTARLETLIAVVPNLTVDRNRRASIVAPALIVRDGPQQSDVDNVGMKRHRLTAAIAGFLEADTDAEIGPAINDLYGRVINVLEADVTLGGPAFDLREIGLDIEIEEAADDDGTPTKNAGGAFYLSVEIEFTTRTGDSGSLAP